MQIRSSDLTTILDVCLERMRRGESIEACVLDYPSEAEELEQLLIAARHARSTFRPPALAPEARQAIQRQLQLAVAARQPAQQRTRAGWFKPFVMRFALTLVVALLSLGGGVAAAQSSLPGSSLYPLKRVSEGVRLRLTSSAAQRAMLHLDFAAARSTEILALASDKQKMIDSGLVDDLDQEYRLAWVEIGQAPADVVHDLVSRYVIERRADVRVFSAVLTHANAATTLQIRRAVRLGEQALAVVDPAGVPLPQPTPDNGVNTGGNSDHNGVSNPGGKPADVEPKATPEGKPVDAEPKATPEGKPADVEPKATPEGKPADVEPKATPEGKPADAEPKATPEGKPADAEPKATPEGKPVDAEPKATPEGKPADTEPKATPEGKPADTEPKATPEGKPEDKPDNTGPKPKPPPKPGRGKP
jgi:hypothetical protein